MNSRGLCVSSFLQFPSHTETYEQKQLKNLCKRQHRHSYPQTQRSPEIRNEICQLQNKKKKESIRNGSYIWPCSLKKSAQRAERRVKCLDNRSPPFSGEEIGPSPMQMPVPLQHRGPEPSNNVQQLNKVPRHTVKINVIQHWKLKSSQAKLLRYKLEIYFL